MTNNKKSSLHYFLGENGKEKRSLSVSDNMFIIRTNNHKHPIPYFKQLLSPHELKLIDQNSAEFPEASVWMFTIKSSHGSKVRDSIKQKMKSSDSSGIEYIGSVLIDDKSGAPQIYTGNLYLQFHEDVSKNQREEILEKYSIRKKNKGLNLGRAIFAQPKNKIGREIFNLANQILAEKSVFRCYPEIVAKRRTFSVPKQKQVGAQKSNDGWVRSMIQLEKAWKITKGKGVKICIIDDGIDHLHLAFTGSKIVASKDIMQQSDSGKAEHLFSSEVHGTAVASVAVSSDPNSLGVAPESELIVVRSKGLGSVLEASAIRWAVDQGADIICCSWGPPDRPLGSDSESQYYPIPDHTRLAIDYAVEKGRRGRGCLVFFAAGNGAEHVKYDGYAKYKNVLSVGSVNKEGQLSKYSDRGHPIFCCFPSSEIAIGEEIVTIYGLTAADRIGKEGYEVSDYITTFGGTSASAPGMAGIAALMLSLCPDISLWDARVLLSESCLSNKGERYEVEDPNYGWGIINANLVVQNALTKNNIIMENLNKPCGYSLHVALNVVDPEKYNGINDLAGCINDSRRYIEYFDKIGFDARFLHNEQATRDDFKEGLRDLTIRAKSGDVVVITYAGHGGTVKDLDQDEDDQFDETLCLYDGQWIDDETKNIFFDFNEGVHVIWIVDSCHSGTNSRSEVKSSPQPSDRRERTYDNASSQFMRFEEEYRNRLNTLKYKGEQLKNLEKNYKASFLCIAACQDDQTALEISGNGLFTSAFFNAIENNESKSFSDLGLEIDNFIKISAKNHPQKINIETYGAQDNDLKSIAISELFTVNNDSKINVINNEQDRFETGALLVDKNDDELYISNSNLSNNERAISSTKSNSWDQAYNYLVNNDVNFVEPEIVFKKGADPSEYISRSKNPDEYLDTYPAPTNEFPNRFTWHLADNFSQLRSAALDACPELGIDQPKDENEYPLIVHIDTGVIPNHCSLPIHFDEYLSNDFSPFKDKDKKLLPNGIEQQGHGNATITLLAGKGFTTELPPDDKMPNYIGGFPYARVVTCKISESVVLLSGLAFAKAVKYAIDIKADVISMSMAGAPTHRMKRMINKAYDKGIVVVSAGGNSWSQGHKSHLPETLMYPARFNRVIAAVGTTFNKTPYLNDLNKIRGVGGRYMQSCYGPKKAMETAIAAYTPNTTWVSTNKGKKYSRMGGGTSSATPQIAAAAALYLHKYRSFFKSIKKNEAWKKVEYVRHALFNSAYKDSPYKEYYGNGILRAKKALDIDPDNVKIQKDPTEKDRLGISALDELIKMWVGEKKAKPIQDMIAVEIYQLLCGEPELAQFEIEGELTKEIALKLLENKFTSEFLKNIIITKFPTLINSITRSLTNKLRLPIYKHNDSSLVFWSDVHLSTEEIAVSEEEKNNNIEKKVSFQFESFTSTRSGDKVELEISMDYDENIAQLAEVILEDGTSQARWIFPQSKQNILSRDSNIHNTIISNRFISLFDEFEEPNSRGIKSWLSTFGRKIKRVIVTIIRVVKDEPKSGLSGLIEYSLNSKSWKEVSSITTDKSLLFIHGTWSDCETSFGDLFNNMKILDSIQKKGIKRIYGFNMSTIKDGVTTNSEDLVEMLAKTKNYNIRVIGFSRGCLVARKAFGKLNIPMLLIAGPHLGTPLAKSENMSKLLNRVTNLFLLYSGPGSPILNGILQFANSIGRKVLNSPGILDMSPDSELLSELQKTKIETTFIATNFEPNEKAYKRIFDSSIDQILFDRVPNDGVVPTKSGLNLDTGKSVSNKQKFINSNETGHFGYFKDKKVLDIIVDFVK